MDYKREREEATILFTYNIVQMVNGRPLVSKNMVKKGMQLVFTSLNQANLIS